MSKQDAHRKTSDVRCQSERDEDEAVKPCSDVRTGTESVVCGLKWMVATRVPCVVGITVNYTRWPENWIVQFATRC